MELCGGRTAAACAGDFGRTFERSGRGQGAGRAVHEGRCRQLRQRVGNDLGRYRRRARRAAERDAPGRVLNPWAESFPVPLTYKAAVLHAPKSPLAIETVEAADLAASDVLVRVKAAGLCHTDLEVIEGSLRNPMPIILGHEAAGIVEQVGRETRGVAVGDHVVLSWNPHCGHCFYCDRDLPILCETYLGEGPKGVHFDGQSKASLPKGENLTHLMFLGAFAEYCVLPAQQAIVVPRDIPFDRACLIGCGVMTGVGAALNVADISYGDTVLVIGCGAVGLAAVQGAVMAGAGAIIAADLDDAKLALAARLGATATVNATRDDPGEAGRAATQGRGADVVLEAAGHPNAFRFTAEAVRPCGQIIWLGKIDVANNV